MAQQEKPQETGVTRRDFLKGLGVGIVGGGLVATGIFTGTNVGMVSDVGTARDRKVLAIPASEGYLLVDTKKCAGCQTCMLACSLVHEGRENVSLSRIQIVQNTFGHFPNDLDQAQCRQCVYPTCLEACPTGALHFDEKLGVRTVDDSMCIGCQRCIEACPQTLSRIVWNFEDEHAQKCDLCANAPYWPEAGGPAGKQACVEVCPMKAIVFTRDIPAQVGDGGYNVNLRTPNCVQLGLSAL